MSFSSSGVFVAQLMCALFLSILFLQSGLDKVLDWSGNKSYIASVFEKTFLRRASTPMLFTVTALEVLAGAVSAAGVLSLLATKSSTTAFLGASLACLNITALFFGQRIAKDYAGASGLVPYFLTTIAAVLLTAPR